MNDSRFLLDYGFKHVTAIDEVPMADDIAATFPTERFDYIISSFEDFAFPSEEFDLVNAQNSLSFIPPDQFDRVFESVLWSLKRGGVFAGQLVGDRDDWVSSRPDMTFSNAEKIEKRFTQMKLLAFREGEEDRRTAATQHRHFIRFIVQRPMGSSS